MTIAEEAGVVVFDAVWLLILAPVAFTVVVTLVVVVVSFVVVILVVVVVVVVEVVDVVVTGLASTHTPDAVFSAVCVRAADLP